MPNKEPEESCPLCPQFQGSPPFKQHWICCEVCSTWYHNHCLHLSLSETSKIIKFHCPDCTTKHGPTEYKRTSGRQRRKVDYIALDSGEAMDGAYNSLIIQQHPHIQDFINWSSDDGYKVQELKGSELTLQYALETRLPNPVKIPHDQRSGLGLFIPPSFDVDELVESMGPDAHVEVMDVLTQNGTKHSWKLSEWRDYFNSTTLQDRERCYNVLSLEISACELGEQIKRPAYVEQVDLVDKVWPEGLQGKPVVAKYCLMGVQDSYTDFHLDFAGTSVYYTVLYGCKQFMFFPPTNLNLKKYVQWVTDSTISSQFLGDMGLEKGLKVVLNPGDVMIIPSGWIHAVYTPIDTLVIGGNFLTSFNVIEQLKIIDIELQTKVGRKFKFPNFSKLMWLTGWKVLNNEIEVGKDIDLRGCIELLEYLKDQLQMSSRERSVKESIPAKYIGKPTDFVLKFEQWLKPLVKIEGVDSTLRKHSLEEADQAASISSTTTTARDIKKIKKE